ncbi:DUF2878 domain-containing protein [Alteromonas aestuariivivens]|uniref:DUF2878 domain-containing protein n=1 Tax=Alteromonas aestuariivivens TaxID=1938339 RepID=A0A3D8M8E2_9ALTE|nr:DUF2878 domain-containing protein [Alteromonas aestuariivivens]RDV26107.1 DUF2878 domain-containing protein [Alteromonas aestuariivivens]
MFNKCNSTLGNLINFMWFQLIWVLALFTQYEYLWGIVVLLLAFFGVARRPLLDLSVAFCVAFTGVSIDIVLALTGVFEFAGHDGMLPVPLWLVTLWIAFALTLRHSMRYLRSRWFLSAGLAAISGPASYYAGLRIGAVDFGMTVPVTLALLALIWVWLLPAFFMMVSLLERGFESHLMTVQNQELG